MSMVVDTNLNVVFYTLMVENIADNYFDKGVYRPHIGKLNAMRQFWNECVKQSDFDADYNHECINVYEIADVISSPEFMSEFCKAIEYDENDVNCFSFANAYHDAMEIVASKKTSIGSLIDSVTGGLENLIEIITPAFDKLNLEKLGELADKIKDEDFADKVVQAYGRSTRIEDIANQVPAENTKSESIASV